jgi:hypothetical protein
VIFPYNHESNASPRKRNRIYTLLGWELFIPRPDFLNSFEPNYLRKRFTINAPNLNINEILEAINTGNEGNHDAPQTKCICVMRMPYFIKRKHLTKQVITMVQLLSLTALELELER